MARASRAVADQHRTAIEASSARLFRQHGLHGVSVAQVMADAGLTHGGFYGHFASKDELAAVACQRAFDDSNARWQRIVAQAGDDRVAARQHLIEPYLSKAHRDAAGHGCPASALAGDIAREPADKPVRQSYLDGIKHLLETWKTTAAARGDTDRDALVEMATLVGAVVLARATAGDAMSDDILDATRAWLLARAESTGTEAPTASDTPHLPA